MTSPILATEARIIARHSMFAGASVPFEANENLAAATLLAAIREGLEKPFADPVHIRDLEFTRAEARAAERVLSRVLLSPSRPSPEDPATGGLPSGRTDGAGPADPQRTVGHAFLFTPPHRA